MVLANLTAGSRYNEHQVSPGRIIRRVLGALALLIPLALLGWGWFAGLAALLSGVPQPWAFLIGAVASIVFYPVVMYLAYLGVVVVIPMTSGDRIDWR